MDIGRCPLCGKDWANDAPEETVKKLLDYMDFLKIREAVEKKMIEEMTPTQLFELPIPDDELEQIYREIDNDKGVSK